MAIPVDKPRRERVGPLRVVVSGYIQPWSTPGAWVEAVEPMLRDRSVTLELLVANHWGGSRVNDAMPPAYQQLATVPGVTTHGLSDYEDFRKLLTSCDVSIDVFERNPERELAMVTRTCVALSCGLPVVHVPFTETGRLVEQFNAGWLVEPNDARAVQSALEATLDSGELLPKQAGVEALGAAYLDPAVATTGFSQLLEQL